MPKLKYHLYSPQCHFRELQSLGKSKGNLLVSWEQSILELPDAPRISIAYEHITHLPILPAYKSILSTAESLAMTGCVTSEFNHELNQNLTFSEKLMLQ
jgi:hypothetical protein